MEETKSLPIFLRNEKDQIPKIEASPVNNNTKRKKKRKNNEQD